MLSAWALRVHLGACMARARDAGRWLLLLIALAAGAALVRDAAIAWGEPWTGPRIVLLGIALVSGGALVAAHLVERRRITRGERDR